MIYNKLIVKASWISIIGNACLSLLKIVAGIITGSLAVVADGIDSASDIITSLITLVTAKIMNKPPDIRFPYGYGKADTIAARFLAFVIFGAGISLAFATVYKIFQQQEHTIPHIWAVYVTIVSIIGKLVLSKYLHYTGKKTHSNMLKANAQNMTSDVMISLTVLCGLIFTLIIKLPVIDSIIALLVSFWILKTAIKIFLNTNIELMDGSRDPENYKLILAAISTINEVHNPHRLRMRKMGNMYVIGVDIEVAGEMTVHEAHQVSIKVENKIKSVIENVYDIVVHIEPIGNFEKHEKFGISESDFKQS